MTAYDDLERCDYFDHNQDEPWSPSLIAVGWLELKLGSALGPVDPAVRDRLTQLAVRAWQPCYFFDHHFCGLCFGRTDGFREDFIAHWHGSPETVPSDGLNLFIPGPGGVFVAPRLILHYIDAHQYQPPTEFVDAVLRCPPMNSSAYFRALRKTAVGAFRDVIPVQPWWHFWPKQSAV